jgi:hypothetical protein
LAEANHQKQMAMAISAGATTSLSPSEKPATKSFMLARSGPQPTAWIELSFQATRMTDEVLVYRTGLVELKGRLRRAEWEGAILVPEFISTVIETHQIQGWEGRMILPNALTIARAGAITGLLWAGWAL